MKSSSFQGGCPGSKCPLHLALRSWIKVSQFLLGLQRQQAELQHSADRRCKPFPSQSSPPGLLAFQPWYLLSSALLLWSELCLATTYVLNTFSPWLLVAICVVSSLYLLQGNDDLPALHLVHKSRVPNGPALTAVMCKMYLHRVDPAFLSSSPCHRIGRD